MRSRRHYLALAGSVALAGCGFTVESSTETSGSTPDGETPGEGVPTARENEGATTTAASDGRLAFSTSAFEDGGTIPTEYTGAGADRSPPLSVGSVPEAAETLALVVDDPDANGYVHWLLWNVPASVDGIAADLPQTETLPDLDGARQGTNDFGELGYRGPLPPADDGPHTYRFTMSAVSTTLDLEAGASRGALADALEGTTADTDRITGEFER
ncbi:YbhB/YbcL family Raf kinase inhibitor-like protein [Halobacteriales archaeon QH_1_68_42]|jgi:Raf kinase inhibitor-like YbhB/YbcL family protein|nr:MAG: YbhB/YbcL family Raf kinase inhibitor-like protein [Halobacteriales archaeon QH_1_68_42]